MTNRVPFRLPHAPLLPLAVALMAGIVAGRHAPGWWFTPWALLAVVGAAVGLSLAGARLSRSSTGLSPTGAKLSAVVVRLSRTGTWQSLAVVAACVVLGGVVSPPAGVPLSAGRRADAVVVQPPVEKPQTVMVELLEPLTGGQRRCYLRKDARSLALRLGDEVSLLLPEGPFVGAGEWAPGGGASARLSRWQRLRLRAMGWRQALLRRLRAPEADADAVGVVMAMTLGDRSALTPALRERYALTGASHVLALSGLHLSMVYVLLSLLTLGRRRGWLVQVATVVALWAFALVTGLPSSVVRAATMLSVYALFTLGGRRGMQVNVLSFTAIVMLLVSPSALFDVGFQLSFMAMLAILLLLPLVGPQAGWGRGGRRGLLRWLWGTVAVSVAAQAGTAPLVAFYFGRFPTWFLLTNLVVVPAAALILALALATVAVPPCGVALTAVAQALNGVLLWLTRLPLASIDGLHPSVGQVVAVYVAEAAVYCLLVRLRRGGAKPA